MDKLTINIIDEINKCQVLCKNCHQLEHISLKNSIDNYYDHIIEKAKNYKPQNEKVNENLIYDMYINKNMRIVDIRKKLNLPKSTVGTIIKRLENKGMEKKKIEKKEKVLKRCLRCEKILDYRNKGNYCMKCKKYKN